MAAFRMNLAAQRLQQLQLLHLWEGREALMMRRSHIQRGRWPTLWHRATTTRLEKMSSRRPPTTCPAASLAAFRAASRAPRYAWSKVGCAPRVGAAVPQVLMDELNADLELLDDEVDGYLVKDADEVALKQRVWEEMNKECAAARLLPACPEGHLRLVTSRAHAQSGPLAPSVQRRQCCERAVAAGTWTSKLQNRLPATRCGPRVAAAGVAAGGVAAGGVAVGGVAVGGVAGGGVAVGGVAVVERVPRLCLARAPHLLASKGATRRDVGCA